MDNLNIIGLSLCMSMAMTSPSFELSMPFVDSYTYITPKKIKNYNNLQTPSFDNTYDLYDYNNLLMDDNLDYDLRNFIYGIINNSKQLEPMFSSIIDEDFWDLV